MKDFFLLYDMRFPRSLMMWFVFSLSPESSLDPNYVGQGDRLPFRFCHLPSKYCLWLELQFRIHSRFNSHIMLVFSVGQFINAYFLFLFTILLPIAQLFLSLSSCLCVFFPWYSCIVTGITPSTPHSPTSIICPISLQ